MQGKSLSGKRKIAVPHEDVRVERMRKKLTEAVLALAAQRDISKANVSELARQAGVHRSTVYEYAESPLDMLTIVLTKDLNQVRFDYEPTLEDGSKPHDSQWNIGTRAILDHVLRHEAIYSGGNTSSAIALRGVLAHHITESIARLFRKGVWRVGVPGEDAARLIAAYHGQASAAAIEAWLATPKPRDVNLIVDVLRRGTQPLWKPPS